MEKVMVSVSKADILQAISQFSKKDLESLARKIEELARTERNVQARFVEAQGLAVLSGLISIGGDALEESERVYD